MPSRWFAAVATVVATILAAACSHGPAPSPAPDVNRGAPLAWTKLALPAGEEPVTLSAGGTDLLIGLRHRGAEVVPGLMVRAADGRLTPVPLRPKSPYAFEAVWQSIARQGSHLLALGGAPGGAHSNTRWTVWSGTTAGLTEQPQEFNTFGGQAAGALFSAVLTPAGGALLGSWGGNDKAGLDAAVWLPKGDRWIRQDPAGTALQSKPELLVGPGFGTTSGTSIVLAGSQVRLGPDTVQQEAAVWRSTSLNQGWRRLALPDPGDRSQAVTAGCTVTGCVVSGYVDGQLAMWRLEGSEVARLKGLPPVAVGDKDRLPPPVQVDGRIIQVAAESGRIHVLSGDGATWTIQDSTGPEGTVRDAVLVGNALYLLAGPPGAPATLWRADVAAVH